MTSSNSAPADQPTLFGHPAGLFTLFFTEMWERFSYYGMRALLVFYMTKGFLRYGDGQAFTVYGAYTAMVYLTPFFGGMLADRLLGPRRAVILGALLMASGQAMLMVTAVWAFYAGLAVLILGNGFFKPNISAIVGSLYDQHPGRRDGGFTIFYMGINLGAAAAPLLCVYVGERTEWQYGFGLATVGMLMGLAVFVLPRALAQLAIALGAVVAAGGLLYCHPDSLLFTAVNGFMAMAMLVAATVGVVALSRGGVPAWAGAPAHPQLLHKKLAGFLPVEWAVYLGVLAFAPVIWFLISGGGPLRADGRPVELIAESIIKPLEQSESLPTRIAGVCLNEVAKPAGAVLSIAGLLAFGYLVLATVRLDRVPRQRMYVVLILMFFHMLFWAFFEQAGSSINLFTDRNVDLVANAASDRSITEADVGTIIDIEPTQEQLGYSNGDQMFTLSDLNKLREQHKDASDASEKAEEVFTMPWKVAKDNVGMRIARRADEIPAGLFQAANPIYILLFGLTFTALWGWLGARGLEPSAPLKFSMGLLQLGLGFVAIWLGSQWADARGMVAVGWLLLLYLLHTTGELCVSPVGLAMVTRLSPVRLVSTVMGGWFLSISAAQFLSAIIAQFTRADHAGGKAGWIPPPKDTLHTYADVYGMIAIAAIASAVICFALVPLLKRWMHEDAAAS